MNKSQSTLRSVLTLALMGGAFVTLSGFRGCGGGTEPVPPPDPPTDEELCASTGGSWEPLYCLADGHPADDPTLCDPSSGCSPCSSYCACPDGTEFVSGSGCTPVPDDDRLLCERTGGFWGGECPPCLEGEPCPLSACVIGCLCPDGTEFVSGSGCVPIDCGNDRTLCERTGGVWAEDCPTCIEGEPCPLYPCFIGCICPDGTEFFSGHGCVPYEPPPPPPDDAAFCRATGGTWIEHGPDGIVCVTEPCGFCICPDGTEFVSGSGCEPVPGGDDRALCESTGGTWNDCGSYCDATRCGETPPPPDAPCILICEPQCECPSGACFAGGFGCVIDDPRV